MCSVASGSPRDSGRLPWLAGIAIVVATLGAYYNSLRVPFLFDDQPAIERNESIRHLWPLTGPLSPPLDGAGVAGRPITNLSLAFNYAWSGLEPASYHAVNLAIHLLAGWTLWRVLRHTLRFAAKGAASDWLAAGTALLWLVHPLQTESVVCVVQRNELLVGFFYLQTLLCFIRSTASAHPGRWQAAAILCCLLGMATKEVMATAPLLVALYDRTFVAGSWRATWQRHGRFHLALAATWVLLAWLMLHSQQRAGTVGFELGVTPWNYLLTQCEALTTYLRLSIWPHPLVLDYGVDAVRSVGAVWRQGLLIIGLLTLTVLLLRRRPWAGFLGAWFFVILAPSSSIVPLTTQPIAEHRLYLPLAAVLVGVVLALQAALAQRARWVVVVLALAMVGATAARTHDYRSAVAIWQDTIAKRPENPRAHASLGQAFAREKRREEAFRSYERALQLRPDYADAENDYAGILLEAGRGEDALRHYEAALKLRPQDLDITYNTGLALVRLGRLADAIARFKPVAAARPSFAPAAKQIGQALLKMGQPAEAIEWLERANGIIAGDAETQNALGDAFFQVGNFAGAALAYAVVARLNPDVPEVRYNLANAWLHANRLPEAITEYSAALQLLPDWAPAHHNLGLALFQSGRAADAIGHFEATLRQLPDSAAAHHSLALALAAAGSVSAAIAHEETALRLQPDFPEARSHLERLRRR